MSNQSGYNPYAATPTSHSTNAHGPRPKGKIIAPGIALIVIASLGMIMTLFSLVVALVVPPPAADPNLPQWANDFQAGAHGIFAAVLQGVFLIVNGLIIAGGIAMIRIKGWGLALTGTIMAMLNFGNLCCLLGLPVGIWSLVILLSQDVKNEFERS